MTNEIANIAVPTFQNKELNRAAAKMAKIANNMRRNSYEAAAVLADVEKSGCYADDGYKSAADFAEKVFGIKKSVAYNMIKIGAEYTERKMLTSNLPRESEKDYTVTQIGEVLPLGHDTAAELSENKIITPDMTCKEIREVVKQYRTSAEAAEGDETAETAPETEPKKYKLFILGDWEESREVEWTQAEIDSFVNQAGFSKTFKGNDGVKRVYTESGENVTVLCYR